MTNKAAAIRPAMVAHKPIRIVFHPTEKYDAPARVSRQGEESNPVYLIEVFRSVARAMFAMTPLANLVPYQAFENALVLHEISHVNAGTMDKDPLLSGNGIYDTISNILDDTHDEYKFCSQYPTYSKYIELALAVLKYKSPAPEDSSLGQDLDILYKMIRFGIVHNSAGDTPEGTAWVSMILSLMHSAIRGDRENCDHAAQALYWFLYDRNNNEESNKQQQQTWEQSAGASGDVVVAVSKKDTEQVQDGAGNTLLTGSAHLETLTQVVQDAAAQPVKKVGRTKSTAPASPDTTESANGYYAGLSSEPLIQETDDEFYQQTVLEHESKIEAMRRAFLMRMEHPDWHGSYEGEFNMAQQERAYEDSFTGEEGMHYRAPRPTYPDMRAVVLTDISGSTDDIKVAYAQAKIMFLAALDEIPGVYTAQVDFNNNPHVNKTFADKLSTSSMHPYSSGGTSLERTLQEINGWDFSAQHNMLFIITDGAIYDWRDTAAPWCELKEQTCGLETWVIEVVENYSRAGYSNSYGAGSWKNFLYSTLEDLPGLMADKVLPYMGEAVKQ